MCFTCLEPMSRALVIDFASILRAKWRMLYMDYFMCFTCLEPMSRALVIDFASVLMEKWRMLCVHSTSKQRWTHKDSYLWMDFSWKNGLQRLLHLAGGTMT